MSRTANKFSGIPKNSFDYFCDMVQPTITSSLEKPEVFASLFNKLINF